MGPRCSISNQFQAMPTLLLWGPHFGKQDTGETTAAEAISPPVWVLSETAGQSHPLLLSPELRRYLVLQPRLTLWPNYSKAPSQTGMHTLSGASVENSGLCWLHF